MVATDTIVGIVGAVLLAGVIVGVFAYEYNHKVEPVKEPTAAEHFAANYPLLSPHDDLDGDGQANVDDDDIDGDGTLNAADSTTMVVIPISGNLGTQLPTGATTAQFPFVVGNGTHMVMGDVNFTLSLPAPLGTQLGLQIRVYDATGAIVSSGGPTVATGSTDANIHFEIVPENFGAYTLEVRPITAAGPTPDFDGAIHIHYTTGAEGEPAAHQHDA